MTTYVTMKSRIADELANDGEITTAQISAAILTAIKHYERREWWFNQKVGIFSTVAAQELYTSSDLTDIPDIVLIQSMLIGSSSTTKKPLANLDNKNIEDLQDGSVTGEPVYYSRYADKIRLYPIPSAVYTVMASYIYKLTTLSADGDTNAWVDECEELIRQAAKRVLSVDVLMADDMAARFATIEKIVYDRIRKEDKERRPQQFLRTDLGAARAYNINQG